jgi:phospho-N-acetylmuramoyl-pentapeptide-transferase
MIILGYLSEQVSKMFAISLFAFCLAMVLTPIYTHVAYKYKFLKKKRTTSTTGEALTVISQQSVRTHDIPTMAGIIMLLATSITTLLFNFSREQTWLLVAALLGGGAVGLIDDVINVKGKGGGVAGLRAPFKFAMITLVAAIGAWFFYYKLGYTSMQFPFVGSISLGFTIIPLFILAVVSTGNAVNISDGLDGLAGGLLLSSYASFGIIAALQGNFGIAAFCMTVCGTLLAYVWFNIPPARFFMGDIGSFSLGTALGAVAMMTDTLFLLPLICLVFVVEAGSSLLQITSKKVLKRKIFIAAPLHHHLQAIGWPKTKVTMRFWIIGQVCAIVAVYIAVVGGY